MASTRRFYRNEEKKNKSCCLRFSNGRFGYLEPQDIHAGTKTCVAKEIPKKREKSVIENRAGIEQKQTRFLLSIYLTTHRLGVGGSNENKKRAFKKTQKKEINNY